MKILILALILSSKVFAFELTVGTWESFSFNNVETVKNYYEKLYKVLLTNGENDILDSGIKAFDKNNKELDDINLADHFTIFVNYLYTPSLAGTIKEKHFRTVFIEDEAEEIHTKLELENNQSLFAIYIYTRTVNGQKMILYKGYPYATTDTYTPLDTDETVNYTPGYFFDSKELAQDAMDKFINKLNYFLDNGYVNILSKDIIGPDVLEYFGRKNIYTFRVSYTTTNMFNRKSNVKVHTIFPGTLSYELLSSLVGVSDFKSMSIFEKEKVSDVHKSKTEKSSETNTQTTTVTYNFSDKIKIIFPGIKLLKSNYKILGKEKDLSLPITYIGPEVDRVLSYYGISVSNSKDASSMFTYGESVEEIRNRLNFINRL